MMCTRDVSLKAILIHLRGRVQGVGFRPFVYRLAHEHGLTGWVRNLSGEVEIFLQGREEALEAFTGDLRERPPPLARPEIFSVRPAPPSPLEGFSILESQGKRGQIHVPPDQFTCEDCLKELADPRDRRHRYPFINCTQCGPRYTLILNLPYDRPHTTMAGFPLCPDCRKEYEDPKDRRFHAQPLACPTCGPKLLYREGGTTRLGEEALSACLKALKEGKVVAIKGIGGYHLVCDARNDIAIAHLRDRKPRPHKPLAVMLPPSIPLPEKTGRLMRDPMRPILLTEDLGDLALSPLIAPGLREIGAMLPYAPLHHLLLEDLGTPLVATSANPSGEPVLIDDEAAERRLAHVAQAFLHHDRPIARPADDPVCRIIAGRPRMLRLGRGCAPLELPLPFPLERPLLATGGHMKNTVALAFGERAIVSPHIADLDSPRSLEVFRKVIEDLQALYGVKAEAVACDAHPRYTSTRWARTCGLPVSHVFHHRAHASALAGEYPEIETWLVFTWDGTGYGEDGTLWGGEALVGRPRAWQRVASFRPFRLPGGDKAGREPWRAACALCWETGLTPPHHDDLLFEAWKRGLNAPKSTAAGRLFDAAASLTGLIHKASFEGQGPMYLEAQATTASPIPLPIDEEGGILRCDWSPLLPALMDEKRPVEARAALFHTSLAHTILEKTRRIFKAHPFQAVGLTGGVFQNRRLAEEAMALLQEAGFAVYLPEKVPMNDGGLSFGQIIEAGTPP